VTSLILRRAVSRHTGPKPRPLLRPFSNMITLGTLSLCAFSSLRWRYLMTVLHSTIIRPPSSAIRRSATAAICALCACWRKGRRADTALVDLLRRETEEEKSARTVQKSVRKRSGKPNAPWTKPSRRSESEHPTGEHSEGGIQSQIALTHSLRRTVHRYPMQRPEWDRQAGIFCLVAEPLLGRGLWDKQKTSPAKKKKKKITRAMSGKTRFTRAICVFWCQVVMFSYR